MKKEECTPTAKKRRKEEKAASPMLLCSAKGCTSVAAVKASGDPICAGHVDWVLSTRGYVNWTPIKGLAAGQDVMRRLMEMMR